MLRFYPIIENGFRLIPEQRQKDSAFRAGTLIFESSGRLGTWRIVVPVTFLTFAKKTVRKMDAIVFYFDRVQEKLINEPFQQMPK